MAPTFIHLEEKLSDVTRVDHLPVPAIAAVVDLKAVGRQADDLASKLLLVFDIELFRPQGCAQSVGANEGGESGV